MRLGALAEGFLVVVGAGVRPGADRMRASVCAPVPNLSALLSPSRSFCLVSYSSVLRFFGLMVVVR